MAGRSRQIDKVVENGSLPENTSYCRKCRTIKSNKEFGKAVDFELDSGGLLSLCKNCVNEVFSTILASENNSIEKATLAICRKLNIRFDNRAVDATLSQIQSANSDPAKFFTLYRAKVLVTSRTSVKDSSTSVDLTYQFDDENIIKIDESKFLNTDYQDMDELRKFWGKGFEPEEIMILEEKFASYSQTNAIDTQPERVLLKYICMKEYEIDMTMAGGGAKKSIANLTKDYESLLKTAGLAPSSASVGSGGKSMDAFGVWLADIMQLRPEEWVEDKSIYKDVDNVEEYGEKHLTSPMRALVTGSREFTLEADENTEDDMEGE